jgi:hypothetical protein
MQAAFCEKLAHSHLCKSSFNTKVVPAFPTQPHLTPHPYLHSDPEIEMAALMISELSLESFFPFLEE